MSSLIENSKGSFKKIQLDQNSGALIYKFSNHSRTSYGLIKPFACFSTKQRQIHHHEKIYPNSVDKIYQDFLNTGVQKNPILLVHMSESLSQLLSHASLSSEIICSKVSSSGSVEHVFQLLENNAYYLAIQKQYQKLANFYLVDGHHRLNAFTNYCMQASLAPSKAHKVLAGLFCLSEVESRRGALIAVNPYKTAINFINEASKHCVIKKLAKPLLTTSSLEFLTFIEGSWYHMKLKRAVNYQFDLNKAIFNMAFFNKMYLLNSAIIRENFTFSNLDHFDPLHYTKPNSNVVFFFLSPDDPNKVFSLAKQGYRADQHSTYFFPKISSDIFSYTLPKFSMMPVPETFTGGKSDCFRKL